MHHWFTIFSFGEQYGFALFTIVQWTEAFRRIRFEITFQNFANFFPKLNYDRRPFDGYTFPCNTADGQNRCMFLIWVQTMFCPNRRSIRRGKYSIPSNLRWLEEEKGVKIDSAGIRRSQVWYRQTLKIRFNLLPAAGVRGANENNVRGSP